MLTINNSIKQLYPCVVAAERVEVFFSFLFLFVNVVVKLCRACVASL